MAMTQRVLRAARYLPFTNIRCTRSVRLHVRMSAGSPQERVVRVAHILLPPAESNLLSEIHESLKGGADFSELAKTHSKCFSAQRGGELGWLSPGSYYPDFEGVAFATAVGDVGQATTPKGLHLIKVLEERVQSLVQQMSVSELAEALSNPILLADDGVQLVDVREPEELQLAALPGFKLFPLSQASTWASKLDELLDPERETIVLCHHGVRSMQAASMMVSKGFKNVKNVTGGIHAYSQGVDPAVPMY